MSSDEQTIAILGAGKLGTVLAQLAIKAGYKVYIAGSGNPEKIALSIKVITPGAVAVTSSEAIVKSDVIILALPLSNYRELSADLLEGKLVIDAMNYWWEVDGEIPELQSAVSSSEMIQTYLSGATIVKALSHIGYHNLYDDNRSAGSPDRKAIAIAGNNTSDTTLVAKLVNRLGFDPVIIGGLGEGKMLEPGNILFGASVSASSIVDLINKER